jgi:hypothetical protein
MADDDAPTMQIPARQKRRIPPWLFFLTGGLALAIAASLIGAAIVLRDDKPKKAAGENLQVVEYEKPAATGNDPFTTAADVKGSEVVRFTPASGTTDSSEPFGGSGSLHVCDREKLVDFLLSHDQQRRVWSDVLNIDSDKDSVSRYVRSLTPVTLTVDTRVTNHMYVNGRAVPFQSILAAGTAVLVDKYGRPVVRCKCGNPLLEPIYYPKIRCKGCPPHYHPPKWCKWRTYDPWYGYPPEWLPPEWRDPYPKDYPEPESWVYKKGKYCYVLYPDPPDVTYPPRWYPPRQTYKPRYYPRRTDTYEPPDEDDDDHYTPPPDDNGCCGHDSGGDSTYQEPQGDTWDDMSPHTY